MICPQLIQRSQSHELITEGGIVIVLVFNTITNNYRTLKRNVKIQVAIIIYNLVGFLHLKAKYQIVEEHMKIPDFQFVCVVAVVFKALFSAFNAECGFRHAQRLSILLVLVFFLHF